MATDYYTMMRDTVGAFGEGVDEGRRRKYEDERRTRERLEFEQRQRDWAEAEARRKEQNDAFASMRALQGGVYDGASTDFSTLPPVSDAGPTQPPATGLHPRSAAPRSATPLELNRAAQTVALAQRDLGAWNTIERDNRDQNLKEARRTEFKRLQALDEPGLAKLFQQSVNANPEVPAMVDWDPKARKFVIVSQIPGIPTQQLSKAEMLQAVMGAWEIGNGDYAAGVNAMVSGATAMRGLQDKNFERSSGIARANADVHFKGLQADNDAQRTRQSGVATAASVAYHRALLKEREEMSANHKEAMTLAAEYEALSPAEQAGAKGRAIATRFNMLNSKPGSMIPLGSQGKPTPELTKLPEDGTRVRDPAGRVLTYQEGVPILPGGVAPSQRPKFFEKLGLPPQAEALVEWEATGRHLRTADGMRYDVNDKADMQALRLRIRDETVEDQAVKEELARGVSRGVPTYGTSSVAPRRPLTANEYVLLRQQYSLPRPLGLQR